VTPRVNGLAKVEEAHPESSPQSAAISAGASGMNSRFPNLLPVAGRVQPLEELFAEIASSQWSKGEFLAAGTAGRDFSPYAARSLIVEK
jgi:hypothetical protein